MSQFVGHACSICGRAVLAGEGCPHVINVDLDLLAKLASGEGGTRTGALKRAGLLEWTVTPRGLEALREWDARRKP